MAGTDIDEVILLVYRAPRSYTREDVVEIQGHGGRTAASAVVRPGDHLELDLRGEIRWLSLKPEGETDSRRLFTAHTERLKATYTLTARSFVRPARRSLS